MALQTRRALLVALGSLLASSASFHFASMAYSEDTPNSDAEQQILKDGTVGCWYVVYNGKVLNIDAKPRKTDLGRFTGIDLMDAAYIYTIIEPKPQTIGSAQSALVINSVRVSSSPMGASATKIHLRNNIPGVEDSVVEKENFDRYLQGDDNFNYDERIALKQFHMKLQINRRRDSLTHEFPAAFAFHNKSDFENQKFINRASTILRIDLSSPKFARHYESGPYLDSIFRTYVRVCMINFNIRPGLIIFDQ